MRSHFISICFSLLMFLVTGYTFADDIFDAVKKGDVETIKLLLSKDPTQINVTDKYSYTLLHWAGVRAQWDVFKALLDYNPNVNAIGADGGTPIHWTCHHDRPEMVKLLIDKGADLTIQNQWGRSPLHVTVRRGCKQVAALLLANGANLNATTKEGWTPLHVAYRSGHKELVDLLISSGASTDIKDSFGKIPEEYKIVRPTPIQMDPSKYDDYVGQYSLGGDYTVTVWQEGDRLCLMEFAPDEIYPIAQDVFYCKQEPWTVTFTRDELGEVAEIQLDFIRRTVRGKKIQ